MAFFTPLIIAIVSIVVAIYFTRLHANVKIARRLGLPYIIVPWYTLTVSWFILAPWAIPVIDYLLPSCLTRTWLKYMDPFWTWHLLYQPFDERGSDTIVTVSAGGLIFNTCSPEIIAQLGANRKDFTKPLELYTILETFGPNLVTTDGAHWKHQRRIIQPSFNDASNVLAWDETIFQTTTLIQKWVHDMGQLGRGKYLNFHDDLRMLALHVVVRGSFGVRMFWPRVDRDNKNSTIGKLVESEHRMGLGQATLAVVSDLKWLFVLPPWFLKWAPSNYLNKIWLGYFEMGRFMQEHIQKRRTLYEEGGEQKHGHDLLDSLISTIQKSSSYNDLQPALTQQEIMSNVFNSLTAGHETTGATLFYTLINLAMHPGWQKQVQHELDTMLEGRNPETWLHGEDMKKLQHSKLDAAILETLRLFPPNNLIPKHSSGPSKLQYKGQEIEVPSNTTTLIMIVSTQRNPHYWPPPPDSNHDCFIPSFNEGARQDTNEFRPERWFVTKEIAEKYAGKIVPPTSDLPCISENWGDHRKGFFVPCKGAFIPWSIGGRQCIGRNFARVELLVAIAIILREWSVELVVEHNEHGDEEPGERRWETARQRAEGYLRIGMKHYITMQLGRGLIPLRIVKRGCKV